MTDRQKKGVGYLVTSGLFALGGGVLLATGVTPAWVTLVMTMVTVIANVFGIVLTAKPET